MPGLVNTMASKLSNLTSDDYEGTCKPIQYQYIYYRNQLPGADRGTAGSDQHAGAGAGHAAGVDTGETREGLPHGLPLPHAEGAEGAGGTQAEGQRGGAEESAGGQAKGTRAADTRHTRRLHEDPRRVRQTGESHRGAQGAQDGTR
jgi:hypothetical protein